MMKHEERQAASSIQLTLELAPVYLGKVADSKQTADVLTGYSRMADSPEGGPTAFRYFWDP